METGLVLKSTGSWYKVKSESGNIFNCRLIGKMREDGIRSTNPIAVGDKVDFESETETTGIIKNIHNRKNYIIRRSSNLSKESHIVAANIDNAFLMVTLRSPKTPTQFIDRFLVSAEAYRIPVTLVFNKIDLYTESDLEYLRELEILYESIGYDCIQISVKEGTNLPLIKEKLVHHVSLFSGNSGVGKSSLINTIEPHIHIKTATVSKSHNKGTHTTTFAEMHELSSGGYIVDTPGLKGFGLHKMEAEEISHYFPEMFGLLGKCEFYNCTHIHEPGCEVMKAVEEGRVHASRYENYVGMIEDCKEEKYRR
jgi:ribosome biogenesis GTPase / thiamine phosphate phosphatase